MGNEDISELIRNRMSTNKNIPYTVATTGSKLR